MNRSETQQQILKELGKIWEEHPELRFGQLLINLCVVPDTFEEWNRYDEESLRIIKQRTNLKAFKIKKVKKNA